MTMTQPQPPTDESPERKLLRELADICHRTGMAQIRKARAILEYLDSHHDSEEPTPGAALA